MNRSDTYRRLLARKLRAPAPPPPWVDLGGMWVQLRACAFALPEVER